LRIYLSLHVSYKGACKKTFPIALSWKLNGSKIFQEVGNMVYTGMKNSINLPKLCQFFPANIWPTSRSNCMEENKQAFGKKKPYHIVKIVNYPWGGHKAVNA
jgi:hypothetical protein